MQQYGSKWKMLTNEKLITIPRSYISSPAEVMECMENDVHAQPVQIINNECIAAAHSCDAGGDVVLIHVKVAAPSLTVRCRSTNKDLVEGLLECLMMLWSE